MSKNRTTSRRDFLKFAGAGSLVLGAAAVPALGSSPRESKSNTGIGSAKNIIFMVSDGMGLGTLSATQQFLKLKENRSSHWLKIYQDHPAVRSLCETYSATGLVTDSAAAASCWGIGERIENGVVNITPDGRKPITLLQKMKAARKLTGLVTTATATHATPAGFVANLSARKLQPEIAQQYLERGVDVILGGGWTHFDNNLKNAYEKFGYKIVQNREDLLAHKERRPVLGLFAEKYIPFEIDRLNTPELKAFTPTLNEMSQVALAQLSQGPEGFFLMIEGGRVDHAGHANDAAAILLEQIAFDDTIATVLKFIEKNPDTLLIITTDHGTGGLQINGVGNDNFDTNVPSYFETNKTFLRLGEFKMSLERLFAESESIKSPAAFRDLVVRVTNLNFKKEDLNSLSDVESLQKILPSYTAAGWTSGNHTSEMVEFCAYGPGASLFTPYLSNEQVHANLLRAAGLS
jgi:alkaline phosphatase